MSRERCSAQYKMVYLNYFPRCWPSLSQHNTTQCPCTLIEGASQVLENMLTHTKQHLRWCVLKSAQKINRKHNVRTCALSNVVEAAN